MKDWILLFQVDSEDYADMMWGDLGRVYYVIKKEGLENKNFDNIWTLF